MLRYIPSIMQRRPLFSPASQTPPPPPHHQIILYSFDLKKGKRFPHFDVLLAQMMTRRDCRPNSFPFSHHHLISKGPTRTRGYRLVYRIKGRHPTPSADQSPQQDLQHCPPDFSHITELLRSLAPLSLELLEREWKTVQGHVVVHLYAETFFF